MPKTVSGAVLSGLREAGRIADIFSGVPYAPFQRYILDDEEEESDEDDERNIRHQEKIQVDENANKVEVRIRFKEMDFVGQ